MEDRVSHLEEGSEDLHLVLTCLQRFSLEELQLDWVEFVWDSQFTECEELPSDYSGMIDREDFCQILQETTQSVTAWTNGHQQRISTSVSGNESQVVGGTSIWTFLVAQNVQYKSLIALLYYFLSKGQNLNATERERNLCMQSASLYFLLLSLPGSGAFKVFHAVLYSKAINTFKLALKLHLVHMDSKGRKNSQGKAKPSQAVLEDSDGSDDDSLDLLNPDEMLRLTNSLHGVLKHFLFYLSHSSLKRSPESLDLTINELVDLTHLETNSSKFNFSRPQKQSGLSSLAFHAYNGLQVLCSSSLHGSLAKVSKMVFKTLLPGVLMVPRGGSDISLKSLSVIREHSLFFMHHLMDLFGKECHESIEIFIQHLANHVPDKAEFRQKAASTIASLSQKLPQEAHNRIVKWLLLWSYNESSCQRLFAVEVMCTFIMDGDRQLTNEDAGQSVGRDSISNKFIFGVLLDRCRDVSPKVRAKAYKVLSDITQDVHADMVEIIRSTFDKKNEEQEEPSTGKRKLNFVDLLQDSADVDLQVMDPLPSADEVIKFLVQSASDESVFVRRSSLQVMFNIVQISVNLREELIQILARHCRDPSLMVRKQMIGYLTDILKRFVDNQVVIHLWVEGVFPIVLDSEPKAAEKALECIWEMVFNNLTLHKNTVSPVHVLPWKIILESEKLGMTKYLTRASGIWHKEGLLKSSIFKVIRSHISTENNDRAWFLLAVITNHVPLQSPHFAMKYFNDSIHTDEGVGLYTLLQVLSVLLSSVSRLLPKDQKALQRDLVLLIQRFFLPPELISMAMDVATVVSQLEARRGDGSIDADQYRSNIQSWAVKILEDIDKEVIQSRSLNPSTEGDNPRLIRQMFTLGELALIIPNHIKEKHFLFFQNLAFDEEILLNSSKISALAIVTLNKMCVTNEETAKKIVPAYGRLLDESKDPAVKNNIIYGLSDLCVKYANVVESIVPQLTSCLNDKFILVKRTALVTIIHLLQEDYLKIGGGRGTFFLRLIQTLLDEEIRSLTEFFMKHRLIKKSPNVMYQHFIEAIFFYNEYTGHSSYNKFIDSSGSQKKFSIAGNSGKESRMFLYRFMLENMNDEQRFQMTYKLCQDVLGGTLEGQIKINDESRDLLKDVLACLASDKIKLVSLRSKNSEEETEEGDSSNDLAGAVAAVAKKTIISQVVKKNIIENIVPIVIALKHKLEELKNPLIDDLMTYLREIMKDYKSEVKEIISADQRLAHEIQFDLKRWENSQRTEESNKISEANEDVRRVVELLPDPQISREVKGARLIEQVLKTAIVNFRSRRRTLDDGGMLRPNGGEPSESRRTLSAVDLADRNRNRSLFVHLPPPSRRIPEDNEALLPSGEANDGRNRGSQSQEKSLPNQVEEENVGTTKETEEGRPLTESSVNSSVFVRHSLISTNKSLVQRSSNAAKRTFTMVDESHENNDVSHVKEKRIKKASCDRAVSTPTTSLKTISFLDTSDLSSISHISAPTPRRLVIDEKRRNEGSEDTIGSFKYRKNQTDDFDKVFKPKK